MSINSTENSGITNDVFTDPLCVTNSDNPNCSLVAKVFNGKNFNKWRKGVRRALAAKNKLGFITGKLKEPEESSKDYARWQRADFMVGSWILSSMQGDLAEDFESDDRTSYELWAEINERFGQSNGPLIYQLKKELAALKQENMSILSYYSKIKNMWDELQSLRKMPICTCGALAKCIYDFVKKLEEVESEDKLMQFLLGLNQGYDNTVTNILSMEPLPNINKAYSITLQIEAQKEVTGDSTQSANSTALTAQKYARSTPNKGAGRGYMEGQYKKDWKREKYDRKCDHCGGRGHTKDGCFKIIGYPDWYKEMKKNTPNRGPRIAANVDTEIDDIPFDIQASDCEEMKSNGSKINSAIVSSIKEEVLKAIKEEGINDGGYGTLVNCAGMKNCLPVNTPLSIGLKRTLDQGEELQDPEIYRRLIGRLIYLSITRPDLSYAVHHLSQFMSKPRIPHLRAALHTLRYLRGTTDYGLHYATQHDLNTSAYSDSDWGSCVFTSRSLNAYVIFLGSHLVSWKTKKQPTVSKSSAEAEYQCMSYTASELVWIEGLLQDLGVQVKLPITLYCDNKSAEALAHNPKFHERTKYLKRDMHYVREQIEAGFLDTSHVSTKYQYADVLTKPLSFSQHSFLCSKLGLLSKSSLKGEYGNI